MAARAASGPGVADARGALPGVGGRSRPEGGVVGPARGLVLGPVLESAAHGSYTTDHYASDRRLGSLDDFTALSDAAHARGLRLLLDGVFNHVGRDFPAFRAVLQHGLHAPQAHWFRL